MQEQINVQLQRALKQIHELVIIELRSEAILKRHLSRCTRYLNATQATFDEEYSDFITGDCDIDLIVLPFGVTLPRNQNASFEKGSSRIFK